MKRFDLRSLRPALRNLWSALSCNNNKVLCLPWAVFIALMVLGPRKCLKQIIQIKLQFSYSGALLWNSLPDNVREIKPVRKFKEQIKHVFESSDSRSAVL